MSYPHLGLRDWPFRVVPEPQFCDFLADRTTLRADVESLLVSLENRPTSTIHLMWSWYGAGKTHTAFYLANLCTQKHESLRPIYTECPRDAKGFPDLYRVTVAQFSIEELVDAYLEQSTRPSGKATFGRTMDPDLSSALTQAALGERPLQILLHQWLLGNPMPRSSLSQLGVGARITTTEQCSSTLASIVDLLTPTPLGAIPMVTERKRIVWIIDEVQRVEEVSPTAQRSLLSGLVGVFNRCPTGLTLLLAYSGEPKEKGLPEWIPADLADRIGLEKTMLLPPLRSDEGRVFVHDLLAHFRLPEANDRGEYFPFEVEAIEALVDTLSKMGDLKPRTLMQFLDASLRDLEPRLRAGDITSITVNGLREALKEHSLTWPARRPKSDKRSRE